MRELFEQTPGVVDVDWFVEADQPRVVYQFDQEKAALNRIGAEQVEELIRTAQAGAEAGLLHAPEEKEDVPIRLRLPIGQRADPAALLRLPLCADHGCVSLGEVTRIVRDTG